jgi:hypothetical protein
MTPIYYTKRLGSSWSGAIQLQEGESPPLGGVFRYCDADGAPTSPPGSNPKKTTPVREQVTVHINTATILLPGGEPIEVAPECLIHLLTQGLRSSVEKAAALKEETLDWDNKSGDVEIQFKKRYSIIKAMEAFNRAGEEVLYSIQNSKN